MTSERFVNSDSRIEFSFPRSEIPFQSFDWRSRRDGTVKIKLLIVGAGALKPKGNAQAVVSAD